jgi:hypothetical protein
MMNVRMSYTTIVKKDWNKPSDAELNTDDERLNASTSYAANYSRVSPIQIRRALPEDGSGVLVIT